MKLLLDEMLSREIAVQLRAAGHDVEAINGHAEWESLADPEVLEIARAERQAVVTNNVVDFRPLHHDAIGPGGSGRHGMIFLAGSYRRTRADIGRIARALEGLLSDLPAEDGLLDAEAWLPI